MNMNVTRPTLCVCVLVMQYIQCCEYSGLGLRLSSDVVWWLLFDSICSFLAVTSFSVLHSVDMNFYYLIN